MVAAKNEKKIIRKQVLILYVLFVYLPMFVSITLFRREETVFFFDVQATRPYIKTGKGTFFRAGKVCFCVFVLEKNRLWTHSEGFQQIGSFIVVCEQLIVCVQ